MNSDMGNLHELELFKLQKPGVKGLVELFSSSYSRSQQLPMEISQ